MHSLLKWVRLRAAQTAAALETISIKWLAVVIALNTFSQLLRLYSSLDTVGNNSSSRTPGRSRGGRGGRGYREDNDDLVVLLTVILSIAALALFLVIIPVLGFRYLVSSIRRGWQISSVRTLIGAIYLLLIALLSAVSNFSGVVDVTAAPLLADISLSVWRALAWTSLAAAATAMPVYLLCRHRTNSATSNINSDTIPHWYLLFLPCMVASATASDLTLIIEPKQASAVLMFAFVLWGFSITPLLAFTAAYIKSRLHQRRESGELPTSMLDLLLPLAPTSQATLAIMSLGVQSRRVWADTVGPATAPLLLGEMAMAVGAILGLMLWASAAAWFISAHVLIVVSWAKQMQRNDGNRLSRLWQPTVSKLAMCHAVYPVGSFAMATAYLAYVWDSPTALYTAEVLVIWVALLLVVALVKSFVDSVHFAAALLRRPKQPPLPTHSRNTSTITTTVITVYGSI